MQEGDRERGACDQYHTGHGAWYSISADFFGDKPAKYYCYHHILQYHTFLLNALSYDEEFV